MIRKATIQDARSIAEVQVDTWRTAYKNIIPDDYLLSLSYEQQEQIWTNIIPHCTVMVAENQEGQLVGFASGGKAVNGEYDDYPGELTAIYILEEYQGHGIGKKLVHSIAESIKALGHHSMIVLVLEDNPAKTFYESLGGKFLDRVEIEIGGKILYEVVYAWENIDDLF